MSSEETGAAGVSPETFQEMIRERKAEKRERAEERRLHDLRRIQEMKSKEGVNPLEIFPKEIWELILDELHPEDRAKMWHLHDVFRDLMENSHLQRNLFPQVLKFKVDHFPRYDGDGTIFGKLHLFHHLRLREVSRTMRNEIDRCIDRDILQSIRGGTCLNKFHKPMRFVLLSQTNNCIEKLDRLLASTDTSPVPRLIYRSISISLLEGEMRDVINAIDDESFQQLFEEFRKKMSQFLERVGSQIWHLKFEATPVNKELACSNGISEERYHAFVEWLSKMPNLKWIEMYHQCLGRTSKCLDSFHLLEKLEDFPKLDRLERLDLYLYALHPKCRKETRLLVSRILQGNPTATVKFLKIAPVGWIDLVSSSSVEELSQLELEAIHFTQGSLLKFLNITAAWPWPLKRMTIKLFLEDGPINPVFKFLQKFPTLQQLTLNIFDVTIGNEEAIDYLKLPQLTELDLVIAPKINGDGASFRFFFSLQFLLYCKNLKTLYWTIKSDCVRNLLTREISLQGNMIDFGGGWGYHDLTKDSNVWQIFPYLSYVDVGTLREAFGLRPDRIGRVYTRELLEVAARKGENDENSFRLKMREFLHLDGLNRN